MMEQCQPANQDTPSNVWDTMLSVLPFGDLVSGNHQGQQPRALRQQAGHTTASDKRSYQLKKCLAMQEPSTHDIRGMPSIPDH